LRRAVAFRLSRLSRLSRRRADAQTRGLFLRWQGPPSFTVEGDAVKLRRLAHNLVINAVKYTQRAAAAIATSDDGNAICWAHDAHGGVRRP